ncbi:hypothetical protein [Halomicrococcus gelatinilyticus]|uniref:hypothetical protein n=1 Tax=Halomicrococcus gelatinilyticus TaxID=1702103 RepID=UPI002E0EF382
MAPYSSSRGMMYSAPPTADDTTEKRNETRSADAVAADGGADDALDEESTTDAGSPNEIGAPGVTDANWTGSVPADD